MTGYATNTGIFHSWTDYETNDISYLLFNVHEYQSKMNFFNRVLRPSYYQTNINHQYLDHCWDCVCFRNLIEQYVVKFNIKLPPLSC